MKRLAVSLALVVFAALPGPAGAEGRGVGYRADYPTGRSAADIKVARAGYQSELYFVKRVVDGDTLRLREGEKVRLLGVDTPETKHPRKPVEYFGPEAYQFTKREIEKYFITMDYDKAPRDRYGRLLAYVFRSPDEFFLNAEIIRRGYGYAYTRYPFMHMQLFVQLQGLARNEGLGLWAVAGALEARRLANPAVATGQADRPDQEEEFWGSSKSSRFHYPGCRWAKTIGSGNLIKFKSRKEASEAGYSPCRACRP